MKQFTITRSRGKKLQHTPALSHPGPAEELLRSKLPKTSVLLIGNSTCYSAKQKHALNARGSSRNAAAILPPGHRQ